MRYALIVSVVVFAAIGTVSAQELSTFVYPSEDELEEAFYSGEIDFLQLLTLQEIIRFGIDSTQLYLLDEIPNLAYFIETVSPLESNLELEQESPFLEEKPVTRFVTGKFSYNYSQRLETDGDNRYRSSGVINIGENAKAAFRLHKEYSGNERFVYRRMEFRPKKSAFKKLVLGSYTTRLGLGTIVGYRGKLLDFSDEIDGESVLYPDYGGYNGMNLLIRKSRIESELMFSQTRDDNHSIRTVAGRIGKAFKTFEPTLIAAVTNLKDRVSGNSIDDFKYGLNFETKYKSGYNRVEISAQAGERNSFGSFVTEGRQLFEQAEINYALWHYDNDYLDLSGGSKAASIRETEYLPGVDFSYSDKRAGQDGGILKTIVALTDDIDLVNSVLYGTKSEDDYNFEFLSAMGKKMSTKLQLRVDHLSRIKNRMQSTLESKDIYRRSRVELRFIDAELYVRTYLSYQSETNEDDYMSLFVNCRYKSAELGETSVWINIGEFKHNKGDVNYWYGYLENKQSLFDNVSTLAKLSHSYRRGAADEHVSTVSIGLEVAL